MQKYLNIRMITYGYLTILILGMVIPINQESPALNNYTLHIRGDYLLHALVYLPLPFLLSKTQSWVRVVLISIFVACLLEALQLAIPYRRFNINDLVANCAGVMLGFLLLPLFRKIFHRLAKASAI